MTQDLVLLAAEIGLGLGLLFACMVFALWRVAATIPTHFHWVMFILGLGPLILGYLLWSFQVRVALHPVLSVLVFLLMCVLAGALDILAYLVRYLLRQRRQSTVLQVYAGTPPQGGQS